MYKIQIIAQNELQNKWFLFQFQGKHMNLRWATILLIKAKQLRFLAFLKSIMSATTFLKDLGGMMVKYG